jgi:hypothetical protein
MSVSAAIQKLVFDRLVAHSGVNSLVAGRVYDRPRSRATFPHITFGPSDFVVEDADCIVGRTETLQIDVWSQYEGGGLQAKQIMDAAKSALHDHEATLATGNLIQLRVIAGRVFRDPDGITTHGVLTVEAQVEE